MHILQRIVFLLVILIPIGLIAQNHPNIVLFLTDDQGWNGTSVQLDSAINGSKSDFYHTPHLEQLAMEGMRFSQAYAPAPKCSPTRNSILSGQSPARTQFTNTTVMVSSGKLLVEPSSITAIEDSLQTIAEWLEAHPNADYQTAHYGKWHIRSGGPDGHGFDDGDGETGNDAGSQGDSIQNDPKLIFSLTERAVDFMKASHQNSQPFYVQISHYAVHSPIQSTQASFDAYSDPMQHPPGNIHDDPHYAAMVEDLDKGLGRVMEVLDSLGIEQNTYVIFISDNGGASGQSSNQPLFRGKSFLTEGGIRVPMVVRGPAIPANSQSDQAVSGYDLFPTIIEWVDGNLNAAPPILDGESLKSHMESDGSMEIERSQPLHFHFPHYIAENQNKVPRSALVDEDWKFLLNYETGERTLYDLGIDIGEDNDLAVTLPDRTLDYHRTMRDYMKMVGAILPVPDPTHANYSMGMPGDLDADSIADDWEIDQMLSVAYDPQGDLDFDGFTNIQEYQNQTDPLSPDGTGIAEPLLLPFRVYPNPARDQLKLEIPAGLESQPLKLEIWNIYGQKIQDQAWTGQEGIDVAGYVSGSYILLIRNQEDQLLGRCKWLKVAR